MMISVIDSGMFSSLATMMVVISTPWCCSFVENGAEDDGNFGDI